MFAISRAVSLVLTLALSSWAVAAERAWWWPEQKAPTAVIRVTTPTDSARMMIESLSGLAAKAVNEGRNDEMLWINIGNVDYEEWLAFTMGRLGLELRPELSPWEAVDRFAKRGIVKGYILYRTDTSPGGVTEIRPDMDMSANVASSMAGLLDSIIVDEASEAEAKAHGLTQLFDARGKTQQWVFDQYKDQFNRNMLCTQDPKVPHVRDLAIAHRAMTVYGHGEPTPSIMAWLEPLSPILGWNGGDEYQTTHASSIEGHIQTATNWCINLPLLMAAAEQADIPRPRHLDPKSIDWNDKRHATSFVITDGDNVQWYMGGLMRAQGDSWYGNPRRGYFPFGWSSCFSQLIQLSPETLKYCVRSQSRNDEFIEWGGGYFYPDEFGKNRPNPEELLARHARRTWGLMQKTGTRIVGFNFQDFSSPTALKTCQIYAREIDGLLGILAFQYYPYEGGAGKTLWVKDARGRDVPVVSARYALWENANQRPRCGTPAKIAREIRDNLRQTDAEGKQSLDWVITHAWSFFRRAPGLDENAENMDQKTAVKEGGVRGYEPVAWCVERLPEDLRVVMPEELLWRIRMQHDKEQTLEAMKDWSANP